MTSKDKKDLLIIAGVFILVVFFVWLFRVLPYGNDWRCIIAECRLVKELEE